MYKYWVFISRIFEYIDLLYLSVYIKWVNEKFFLVF